MAQTQNAELPRYPPPPPPPRPPQQPQYAYQQPYYQPPQAYPQAQMQQIRGSDSRRYLIMAEQGIILSAVIAAIIVILYFLQGQPYFAPYTLILDVVKLLAILVLISGLAYIGLTGVREARIG